MRLAISSCKPYLPLPVKVNEKAQFARMRSGCENGSTVVMLSPVSYKRDICSTRLKSVVRIRAAGLIPRLPCTLEIIVGSKRITNHRAEESPEGEDRHFGRRDGHDDPGAAAGRSGISRLAISEAPARPARELRRSEPHAARHRSGDPAPVPRSRRGYHQNQ